MLDGITYPLQKQSSSWLGVKQMTCHSPSEWWRRVLTPSGTNCPKWVKGKSYQKINGYYLDQYQLSWRCAYMRYWGSPKSSCDIFCQFCHCRQNINVLNNVFHSSVCWHYIMWRDYEEHLISCHLEECLTHWGRYKWPLFRRRHFHLHFCDWNCIYIY